MNITENYLKYCDILYANYLSYKRGLPDDYLNNYCSTNNIIKELKYLKEVNVVSKYPFVPSNIDFLSLELIPRPCFYENVRNNPDYKSKWKLITTASRVNANNSCEICGKFPAKKEHECHEEWIYDDKSKIQMLSGFKHICYLCHRTKHFFNASNYMKNWSFLFKYLQSQNQWTDDLTKAYITTEERIFDDRSDYSWIQDLSFVNVFLNQIK